MEEIIGGEDNNEENILIVGDLIFDMFCHKNNKLRDFCENHGFINTIKEPTRVNHNKNVKNTATLLDVILCLFLSCFISSAVFPCPFSDHSLVISSFNYSKPKRIPPNRLMRVLSKENIVLIIESMRAIFSSFCFKGPDVNSQ